VLVDPLAYPDRLNRGVLWNSAHAVKKLIDTDDVMGTCRR
jgi:hypothetical protein